MSEELAIAKHEGIACIVDAGHPDMGRDIACPGREGVLDASAILKTQITMLYLRDHEVRHVGLNRPHPARMQSSWYGDSVGNYDGDTLVIDTVGVRTDRPVAMVDMYGTPYSQALHVIERYRLIDYDDFKTAMERTRRENVKIPELDFDLDYRGKHLQLQFTVEDEGVFTLPWSGTITYARPVRAWEEHMCSESTHDFLTGKDIRVPRTDKPDF
jgi:hypothetical protein